MVKRIKHNNLLPWFTMDRGQLPGGGWARRSQALKQKKMLTSLQAYSMGYYNKERIKL